MAEQSFLKVLALPEQFTPNAVYMVSAAESSTFELYVANNAGTAVRKLDPGEEILSKVVSYDAVAPDPALTPYKFWWDATTGALFVRYENEGQPTWVEAMPSNVLELDGNGTSNKAARADHTHDSVQIESDW